MHPVATSATAAPAHGIDRALAMLATAAGTLAGIGVAAILVMVGYEIIARYLFDRPTSWSVEMSTYAVIAVAYLGTAYAHANGANIRVTVLLDALPPHARRWLEEATAWGSLLFVLAAAAQTYRFVLSNYTNATKSYVLLVPQWLPNLPILLGFLLLAAAIVQEIRQLARPVATWRTWAGLSAIVALLIALAAMGAQPLRLWPGRIDAGMALISLLWAAAVLAWSGWRMLLTGAVLLSVPALLLYAVNALPPAHIAPLLFLLVLALFLIGFRIAFGLGLIALCALYALLPFPLPGTVAERAFTSLDSFSLTSLPMFVLMGALLVQSGIARELFDALMKWMGRLPGGIAHAAMGACSVFAAVSGSSIATAATIGSVACPQMVRHGYATRLAYGSVAAGGTLGILIPPSVPLIIYGTLASVSVSKLFIGAIVPGLLMTLAFMVVILVWALLAPGAVPKGEPAPWSERMDALAGTAPFGALILAVLGSLYFGVVTPTEAGAVGAFLAALLCLVRGRLSGRMAWSAILETVVVTGFILLIVFTAALLTFVFDFLRISQTILSTAAASGLSPFAIFLVLCVFYIVLGMFLDSISLITLTLPVVFPLIVKLGLDPVWFGIVLVILVEIGLITPPVGLNLFVLQGIGKVSMKDVAIGAAPFGCVMVLFLLLLYAVPEIVTWLPRHVR